MTAQRFFVWLQIFNPMLGFQQQDEFFIRDVKDKSHVFFQQKVVSIALAEDFNKCFSVHISFIICCVDVHSFCFDWNFEIETNIFHFEVDWK